MSEKTKTLILCAQCLETQNPDVKIHEGEEVQTFTFISDPDVKASYLLVCPLCREDLLEDMPNFLRYGRRLWGNLMARIEDLWPSGEETIIPMVFQGMIAGAREIWRVNQTLPWKFEQKKPEEPVDT